MINVNGVLVSESKSQLSVNNRSFLYGDGVFETLKAVNSKILFWEDHYFRLMASMRILRMRIPNTFTPEYLEQQLHDLLAHNGLNNQAATLRLTVFRNEGGKYTPKDNSVSFVITSSAIDTPFYKLSNQFYEVDLYKDHYVAADLLSTIKSTSKAIHVTGSIYAKENELDNCLMLNTNKQVTEALNGNIFLIKENIIKTPPLQDGCLRGVMRKQLINLIKLLKDKYVFVEESISPFELQKADELFITNAVSGIISITKYRKKEYKNDVALDLLTQLNVKVRLS